ncbi:hypothetical protein [Halorubrum halodurans]|uniref:Uncharacterized protein n=1 Tax=Halorubrum halodurans TaxID=1383851 RepID=A0A256ICD8_9EURY|nr:hypothetical protein [Halorubrum halodurans]OYR54235.1 hypothetical protein DJ70_14430 [Halorubrum halodurans]
MAVTPIGIAINAITRTIGPLGQIAFVAIAAFALAAFLGYDPIAIAESWIQTQIRGIVGV